MTLEPYYRIVQASATKYRIQCLEERTAVHGWLWWRKRWQVREWQYILYLDKSQSTYHSAGIGMPGQWLPGKWVPMNFNSQADAERHLAELRMGYPLVVKDPA